MGLDPAGQGRSADAHKDPGPPVKGFERRRVDHPRAPGDRLQSPAPLAVEPRRRHTKAEPGLLIYRPHRSSKDPDLFIFYEQYKDDAAFELHRKAPYLAAYRERREREGLTEGPAEVEIYRSLTD